MFLEIKINVREAYPPTDTAGSDGYATVNVTGGIPPYMYHKNNINNNSYQYTKNL